MPVESVQQPSEVKREVDVGDADDEADVVVLVVLVGTVVEDSWLLDEAVVETSWLLVEVALVVLVKLLK